VGASLYYRGALAAAYVAQAGFGGWVAERCRSRKDGTMEIYGQDHRWHAPDVVWTEFLGCTQEDLDATRRARANGQVIVGDLDDDVWQVPKTNDAHAIWSDRTSRPLYFEQLAACNGVICSTIDLCYKALRLGPPVFLIRNAIDTSWITAHDPAGLPVSWIGSTPWRANDLRLLRAAGLSQWLDDHGQRFYHGGEMVPPEVPAIARAITPRAAWAEYPSLADQAGLHGDQVVAKPNVPFAEYPGLWHDVGVSLVPLEDVAFNRAKSWLKGLESAAAGVPVVASAGFPEYNDLRDEVGVVVRTFRNARPKELLVHLDELLDPDLRREEGAANRRAAERYDIRHKWTEWLAVLDQISRDAGGPALRIAEAVEAS